VPAFLQQRIKLNKMSIGMTLCIYDVKRELYDVIKAAKLKWAERVRDNNRTILTESNAKCRAAYWSGKF
jgi:hypothetical protein